MGMKFGTPEATGVTLVGLPLGLQIWRIFTAPPDIRNQILTADAKIILFSALLAYLIIRETKRISRF